MRALIVVDQQADFEPQGALPVAGGDEIAKPIGQLMREFGLVVVTQDSHPKGHISFASSYAGKKPFDLLTLDEVRLGELRSSYSKETLVKYLSRVPNEQQVLWPDHCVTGTDGWKLNPLLPLDRAHLILRKGTRIDCDSYSAFFENDGTPTGLAGFLRERQVDEISLVGLAGDYCVLWSAEDAVKCGFKVNMDPNLTRFVNFPEGSRERSLKKLQDLGIHFRIGSEMR